MSSTPLFYDLYHNVLQKNEKNTLNIKFDEAIKVERDILILKRNPTNEEEHDTFLKLLSLVSYNFSNDEVDLNNTLPLMPHRGWDLQGPLKFSRPHKS